MSKDDQKDTARKRHRQDESSKPSLLSAALGTSRETFMQAVKQAQKLAAPNVPQTTEEPTKTAAETKPGEQIPLPGVVPWCPGKTAPMNNAIARTSLFAPNRPGRRKILDMVQLPAPDGCKLWYFGKQLCTGGDQDVYLVACKLAASVGPDTPVIVNRAQFLKLMGWKDDSKKAYKWLKDAFDRIATGVLYYDVPTEEGATHLISSLKLDKESGQYFFTVPADTFKLFGRDQFAYIDLEKRALLTKKVDIGKWIQCYAGTHSKAVPHEISVATLYKRMAYEGRIRDFRKYLEEALADLVNVGILEGASFYDNLRMVKWKRK